MNENALGAVIVVVIGICFIVARLSSTGCL